MVYSKNKTAVMFGPKSQFTSAHETSILVQSVPDEYCWYGQETWILL